MTEIKIILSLSIVAIFLSIFGSNCTICLKFSTFVPRKYTNDFRPTFIAIELESQIITLFYISQMSEARCNYKSHSPNRNRIVRLLHIICT